jgi:hypothetical protein
MRVDNTSLLCKAEGICRGIFQPTGIETLAQRKGCEAFVLSYERFPGLRPKRLKPLWLFETQQHPAEGRVLMRGE